MIWNEEMECISRDDLEELQIRRLQDTVKRVYENVPYYKRKLEENNIYPEDIESLEDIKKVSLHDKR